LGIATLSSKEGQNLNFAIPGDEVARALASTPKEAQVTPLGQTQGANRDGVQVVPDIKAIEELQKQHKESEALKIVSQFLGNHPVDANAWSMKAKILGSLNLGAEAVEAQKTVIKLDADNAGAWADMVFYLSLVAGGTPKPNGIESEICSSAEHAIALGDDREMTWDLLVWSCKAMGDSTAAAKYEATRDEKISHGELSLRTMALSNLIPGDYARIDLDDYVSGHSLTIAIFGSNSLFIRGGPTEVEFDFKPPLLQMFNIDAPPRKSKNGHWYIAEDVKTRVLEPALGNVDIPDKPEAFQVYLSPWPSLPKEQAIATDGLIREIVSEHPANFRNFADWKPSSRNAVLIFCSVNFQNMPDAMRASFQAGLLPQAPVSSLFRTQKDADRDLQLSTLLETSVCRAWGRQAEEATQWHWGADLRPDTFSPQHWVEPACPTIYWLIHLDQRFSNAEIKKAKNDAKTGFVKGLSDFNTQLALIAAARQKDKSTSVEKSASNAN
jgi:hypothetical protein